MKFCHANFDATIPDKRGYTDEALEKHKTDVNTLLQTYLSNMEAIRIRQGASSILALSALGNQLLQHNKLSNQLVKEEPDRCAAVVNLALNHMYVPWNSVGSSISSPLLLKIPISISSRLAVLLSST